MNIIKAAKLSESVDAIGVLDATIADLQAKRAVHAKILKAEGPMFEGDVSFAHEGALFAVNVTLAMRNTTAWKKVAEKLEASRQLIAGNTKASPVVTLKVTARNIDRRTA